MTVLQRIAAVFARVFAVKPEQVTDQTTPEHVSKWDSLGHMGLVSGLEKEFGLQFEVDEIMEMSSVANIAEILSKHGVIDP